MVSVFVPLFLFYSLEKVSIKEKFKIIILVLLVLDFILFTLPIEYGKKWDAYSTLGSPQIFYKISKEKGEFSVLLLPLEFPFKLHEMFYQTLHEKKIIGGHVSRNIKKSWESVDDIRIAVHHRNVSELVKILRSLKVRYIILSKHEKRLVYNHLLKEISKNIYRDRFVEVWEFNFYNL